MEVHANFQGSSWPVQLFESYDYRVRTPLFFSMVRAVGITHCDVNGGLGVVYIVQLSNIHLIVMFWFITNKSMSLSILALSFLICL